MSKLVPKSQVKRRKVACHSGNHGRPQNIFPSETHSHRKDVVRSDWFSKLTVSFYQFLYILTHFDAKVFIVTGGASGLGFELVNILYARNGKVYRAGRSEDKALAATKAIKSKHPESTGQIIFLHLDLNDLSTIRKSANEFLAKETRLDVLFNNAGVMVPPQGSKTAQGYELQLGTNNLAPFLFTTLLTPLMAKTATTAPKDSVRVVWVSSSAVISAPKPAVDFDNMDYHKEEGIWTKYSRSKAGLVIYAAEFARRTSGQGIINIVSLEYSFFCGSIEYRAGAAYGDID